MEKYIVTFIGRKVGSIGITFEMEATIEVPIGSTHEDKVLALYNAGYDNIRFSERLVFRRICG